MLTLGEPAPLASHTIRLSRHPSHTPPMSSAALLPHALRELRGALTDLIGWAGLHLGPQTLTHHRATRASGRLRALEIIARRVIWLMALGLVDAQACPPERDGSPDPGASQDQGEGQGPGPVSASGRTEESVDEAHFPRVRRLSFALVPRAVEMVGEGPHPAALLRQGGTLTGRSKRDAAKLHHRYKRLAARIAALQAVLTAPEPRAKRLARRIVKWRETDDPPPVILPRPRPRGLPPELSLLAGLLPAELSKALAPWDTS
ncbi:MAG: hypothetical protein AAFQ84_04405 [Pseudomonadota bacterium]